MYENGITVEYRTTTGENGWSGRRYVWLPGWCAGDPDMAVALHLYGNRDYVSDVEVTDWHAVEDAPDDAPTARLEYLRGELRGERISYGELAELQDLSAHIDAGDTELLEAAGVPEYDD